MKKLFVVLMTVLVITGSLVLSASAAGPNDKLIVLDAGGTNTMFVVRDNGSLGLGIAAPLYSFDLSNQNVLGSQMHFSLDGTDKGGWITSASENNFFLSSGIAYGPSGWIQKAADGNSVIAGSSSTRGYAVFLQQGCSPGSTCPVNLKFQVTYDGHLGVGTAGVTTKYITTGANGAYLSTGGVWTNASSKEFKQAIKGLTAEQADATLAGLNPVTFAYKTEPEEQHVGFIAEDVPDLVATKDRKGLSSMDIVAVLTKVVQEQKKMIEELSGKLVKLEGQVNRLRAKDSLVIQIQQ